MAHEHRAARPGSPPARGIDRERIRDRLLALLTEICGFAPNYIQDSSTIDRDFDLESVQMVELQVAIEQEFDVTIDFLEVLRLNSFRRITDYVHALTLARTSEWGPCP